jgi:hypothetical protein
VLWEKIIQLSQSFSTPWIIGGDFNTIRDLDEDLSSFNYDNGSMEEFNECIQEACISNLPFFGSWWSWSNN